MYSKIYLMAAIMAFASVGALLTQPTLASAQSSMESFLNSPTSNNSDTNEPIKAADATASTSGTAQPSSLLATEPVSTSLSCGEVITKSVKLSANLDCKTDGIIVGGNGITIDLNGYTIKGPGPASSKIGVMLANNNGVQVLGPGTITNFQAGILNTGGDSNSVNRVTFTENEIAIFNTGAKTTSIQENMMDSNKIGFASHSSSGTVMKTNLLLSNALAGVTLVNSQGNEVSTNIIKGSVNGVFVDGQSTLNNVNTNTVVQNTGVDLNNGNGLPTNINHNVFTDNNCNMSVPGGLCIGK
jgi:nitrous oxidase accessory protein NosD